MSPRLRHPASLTLLATLLLSAGCLERKETITVKPSGAVDIEATFKGDLVEFEGRDALPTQGSAWRITDEPSTDANGTKQLYRTATLSLAPDAPLPSTFATSDADAAVSLRFPTTITRELRADGMYFHFKRTYQRRDDARFTTMRRCLAMDTKTRDAMEDPASITNPDERHKLVTQLRDIELDKQLAILDLALGSLTKRPQDQTLRIRAAVVDASNAFDLTPTNTLLAAEHSDKRDHDIQAEADKYLKTLAAALDKAVADASLTPEENHTFRTTLTTEQKRRQITEALAAHLFEVRLELPGEIIASNADRAEDHQLVWEFQSPAIFDTDKTLMATSRISARK